MKNDHMFHEATTKIGTHLIHRFQEQRAVLLKEI